MKFALISDAIEIERPQLLDEFWQDLSEIYSIKLHEQAKKKNLKYKSNNEIHRLAYMPLVFSEEEESKLKAKWTKAPEN